MVNNIWNNITEWFKDRSERNKLIRCFNESAKESFICGIAPTVLKSSISKGEASYKHTFSAWYNTGFRIQELSGKALSKDETIYIGETILGNPELVRKLIVLGWDTLEVHSDKGTYGCRWKLTDYANIGLMIN